MRAFALSAALSPVLAVLLFSPAAQARNGGLYLELAPAWGLYSTEEVIIEEGNDDFSDYPVATFVPQLKAGISLFGWAGGEAHIAGHWWDWPDAGGDPGGAGYVGGVVRVIPLEVLSYILPDDVKIPSLGKDGLVDVTWKDRPFDLGISMGGGYTMVGEDYAYQGSYFQWGFDIKAYITPNFSIGLDFPFRHPAYEPFRWSNFNDQTGFCTDGEQAYGIIAGQRIDVSDNVGETFPQAEVQARDIDEACDDGRAPSAFFFAPALTIAGVFDFGI